MSKKQHKPEIVSVTFSYVGTDTQFDEFLKMMVHDYLAVDQPYTQREPVVVDSVESDTA